MASAYALAQRDLVIQPIQPRKQIALVIGNAAYPSVGRLQNSVNDAEAVARQLRELKFDVILAKDATRRAMGEKIDEFIGRLGSGDVALFYYAGHGVQVDSENYLIPVDFAGNTESDVRYDSHPIGKIQDRMERSGAQLNILVLDACRNNPFRVSARSATRGWAAMSAGRGTFIAFATAPGSVASDNPNAPNGLFTKYLLEALRIPGLGLSEAFDYVRTQVDQASGSKQLPWTHSSVVGRYSFRPDGSVAPVPAAVAPPPSTRPNEIAPRENTRTVGIGELQSTSGSLNALPQVWRNIVNNELYRFKFDSEHLVIYHVQSNRVVADLALKRDKKDSSKDKYVGTTALSKCPNGGYMEVTKWSPTRIESNIEVPNAQNQCLTIVWLKMKIPAAFIPEK